jgi:hypothetical protein
MDEQILAKMMDYDEEDNMPMRNPRMQKRIQK